MVKTAFLPENVSQYISSLSDSKEKFKFGLLFGQSFGGKDHIVHACLTSSEDQKIIGEEINEGLLVGHAKRACRMLSGGMYILGVFLVSQDPLLSPLSQKLKKALIKLHQELNNAKYLYGNAGNERIILNFATSSRQFSAKSFDGNGGFVSPVETKMLQQPGKWTSFECKYDIDFLYHVQSDDVAQKNLKKHMGIILEVLNKRLSSARFLFNGELRESEALVENLTQDSSIKVSIFECCSSNNQNKDFEIYKAGGQIRLIGQVASKIWLNPKTTILQASNSISEDIMRSLAARFEMHWDSLTEEEQSQEVNTIHDPPRRIFIPILNNELTVCDYLFPGESYSDLTSSLLDFVGIKNFNFEEVEDLEGQADFKEFSEALADEKKVQQKTTNNFINKTNCIYFIGLAVAFFILVISIVIHFLLN